MVIRGKEREREVLIWVERDRELKKKKKKKTIIRRREVQYR